MEGQVRQHYNLTLAILAIAGTAFALQQTMVIPALPALQREFHTSANWVTWIATGFLLSSSVLTPILGKLGDTYGKERLLVISMAIFGIASHAACGDGASAMAARTSATKPRTVSVSSRYSSPRMRLESHTPWPPTTAPNAGTTWSRSRC